MLKVADENRTPASGFRGEQEARVVGTDCAAPVPFRLRGPGVTGGAILQTIRRCRIGS